MICKIELNIFSTWLKILEKQIRSYQDYYLRLSFLLHVLEFDVVLRKWTFKKSLSKLIVYLKIIRFPVNLHKYILILSVLSLMWTLTIGTYSNDQTQPNTRALRPFWVRSRFALCPLRVCLGSAITDPSGPQPDTESEPRVRLGSAFC